MLKIVLQGIGVICLAFAVSSKLHADLWQGSLKDGSQVQVDPVSRRPMVNYRGGSSQLWDGTHEMSDGSVIIVRDGVVVPDERMYQTWRPEHAKPQQLGPDRCEQLMRKTCGMTGQCGQAKACDMARQLAMISIQELSSTGNASSAQDECRKGLADPGMFPACAHDLKQKTPCRRLVDKVCGAANECGDSQACDPARQLLGMEREERLQASDGATDTYAGRQCGQAMDNAFFAACKP